jgi:hypothetical protein
MAVLIWHFMHQVSFLSSLYATRAKLPENRSATVFCNCERNTCRGSPELCVHLQNCPDRRHLHDNIGHSCQQSCLGNWQAGRNGGDHRRMASRLAQIHPFTGAKPITFAGKLPFRVRATLRQSSPAIRFTFFPPRPWVRHRNQFLMTRPVFTTASPSLTVTNF